MQFTPKASPYKYINEFHAQGCEVEDDKDPIPGKILEPATHRDHPEYNNWGWDVIDRIEEVGHSH